MIPINIQVSRSKVKVKGQAYSWYVGEGRISFSQTALFFCCVALFPLNRISYKRCVACSVFHHHMMQHSQTTDKEMPQWDYLNICILTLTLTWHLFSSSTCIQSRWPPLDAQCKGVDPALSRPFTDTYKIMDFLNLVIVVWILCCKNGYFHLEKFYIKRR